MKFPAIRALSLVPGFMAPACSAASPHVWAQAPVPVASTQADRQTMSSVVGTWFFDERRTYPRGRGFADALNQRRGRLSLLKTGAYTLNGTKSPSQGRWSFVRGSLHFVRTSGTYSMGDMELIERGRYLRELEVGRDFKFYSFYRRHKPTRRLAQGASR